jgi:hypothetical protein
VEVDDAGYWLHPRRLGRTAAARLTRQAGSLQAWLNHHWITPVQAEGFRMVIDTAQGILARDAEELSGHETLKVYAGRFIDGIKPAWC